jgi:hypothetical protein
LTTVVFHEVGVKLFEATDLIHHFTIRNQAVVIVDDTLHGKGNVRNIRLLSLFFFLVQLVGCTILFCVLVSAHISVALAPHESCHWMIGAMVFWAYTRFVLGRVRVTMLVFGTGTLQPHLLLCFRKLCRAVGGDLPTTIQLCSRLGPQNFIFLINDALLVLLYAKKRKSSD